jgi:hypothetical protein
MSEIAVYRQLRSETPLRRGTIRLVLPFTKSNRIALIGLGIATAGVILYTQLDRIVDLRLDDVVVEGAALGSLVATIGGMLTATVGCVTWARRASSGHVVSAAVLTCSAIFFVVTFGNINIHGPSAILMFVVLFGGLDAVVLFLTLGLRSKG